jgi:hypothetical protein
MQLLFNYSLLLMVTILLLLLLMPTTTILADNNNNHLRSSIQHTLLTSSSSQATPLPPTNIHVCTNVPAGSPPNIREDIYYVAEFRSARDGVTRYLARGMPIGTRTLRIELYARENLNAMFMPNAPLQQFDTNNRATQGIHWRFKFNPSTGKYSMINGHSGQFVNVAMDEAGAFDPKKGDYMLTSHPSIDAQFSFSTCDVNGKVWLTTEAFTITVGGRPRRGGFVREHPYNWQFSANAEWRGEIFFTDCCDSCPAGTIFLYERTMQCVFCDDEACKRPVAPLQYQYVPVKFTFYELTEYYAADVPSGAVQSTTSDPATKYIAILGVVLKTGLQVISNKISYGSWVNVAGEIVNKFGKLATAASVGLGILSFAISFAIESTQPTIEDKLQALEDKIMASVKTLVADTVVGFAVNQALNTFSTARFRLNTEVKTSKRNNFISNNLDAINDDAIKVAGIAADINGGLDTIKPGGLVEPFSGDRSRVTNSPSIPNTATNLKLVQQGYILYISSLLDMISALSESVMLKAYSNPSMTCTEIMGGEGIAEHIDRQGFFLEQMQSFLEIRRKSTFTREIEKGGTYAPSDINILKDSLTGEELFLSMDPNDPYFDAVTKARQAELVFDMTRYGYRLDTVKDSLNQLLVTTQTLCEKLKTDKTFKEEYVKCAQGTEGVGCV